MNEVQIERFYYPPPDWSWAADEPITHCKQLKTIFSALQRVWYMYRAA